jgi:uncharacterized protein YeaO (DUF488 family)
MLAAERTITVTHARRKGQLLYVPRPPEVSAMPIRTRRWNDPKKRGDGFRILVCRYRPRALPKKDETWDVWYKEFGPSKELHAAFYGKHGPPIGWEEYRKRYLEEMAEQQEGIDELAALVAEGKTITLLCSSACEDEAHCHRTLLRQLIEARVPAHASAEPARADVSDMS